MNPKTIFVTFGITKTRFRDNFEFESEIQKYMRVFSYQMLSIRDYLYEFLNTYRFFEVGLSFKGYTKNFPEYSITEDSAEEISLVRLATAFNIQKKEVSDVLFSWESKFIERVTKEGLNNYLKLFIKYDLNKRSNSESLSSQIAEEVAVYVYEWGYFDISDDTQNVYASDNDPLTIYVEILLPKKYFQYLSYIPLKIKEIFEELKKVVAVGIKIKFIEFVWR